MLLLVPVVPPLLTTGMTSSDDRACGCVAGSCGSDGGTGCCTLSFIVGLL